MKSHNIAVDLSVSDKPTTPPLVCILSFSLQDDIDSSAVTEMFRNELISVIVFSKSTGAQVATITAILKAAKRVQDNFHCESFMLTADSVLSIGLC